MKTPCLRMKEPEPRLGSGAPSMMVQGVKLHADTFVILPLGFSIPIVDAASQR